MRVFISSVIRGFEAYRTAVVDAVESLGYSVVRAEDFGARSDTPRRACLEAVRDADLTIVLLGDRYGEVQDSRLSATHEEFREAREYGAVAAYVQEGVDPEPPQREFIEEARDWATGRMIDTFRDPGELRAKVTRMLHQHVLRRESGGPDPSDLIERARSVLPRTPGRSESRLHLIVAGGPRREIFPPAEREDPESLRKIMQRALFGPVPIFDPSEGTDHRQIGNALKVEQKNRSLQMTEDGTVAVTLPAVQRDRDLRSALPVLVEEDLSETLTTGLEFISWILDEVDPNHRLSDVIVLAAVEGGSYLGWQTREEQAASRGGVSVPMHGRDLVVVPEQPRVRPRAAIRADRRGIVEDLVVRLRRELRA